ncbi:LuxR C-terminal-related transcriptional regulator [Hoyosella rhizosphaerae]|uniref:LuxR C-terminal-related transcriptional regulator n=1 Tax=Hoyosella rhizosphaerae TaxID=1755582 RepID=UPI0035562DB1
MKSRETEVLRLVAEGLDHRDITATLQLADSTIKNHISTILPKRGARDRTNAVICALHQGILCWATYIFGASLSKQPRHQSAQARDFRRCRR